MADAASHYPHTTTQAYRFFLPPFFFLADVFFFFFVLVLSWASLDAEAPTPPSSPSLGSSIMRVSGPP